MNKNILIGLLIGVVVVGGIAYWVTTGNLLNTTFNASSTTDNASNVVDKSVTVLPGTTPSNPTRKAGQPLINSNTRVVLVSNSTVLLNGGVTPNGSHTTYWYEYGQTNSLGNKSTSQVIGSGFNNIPVPNYISGLKANTTYQTRVVAQNAYGQVKGSVTSFTTNTNPPPVGKTPAAQTNATENITRVTADLNGKVNPNNSPTGYWFEYGETTDLGNVTNLQSAGSGSNQQNVSASLSDLKPTTKYYFRLNAQNDFGTTNSALSNFTTQGPPAPGLPTARTDQASNVATSSAVLNGKANPNSGTTSYWFEYSINDNLSSPTTSIHQQLNSSGSTGIAVSLPITGLQNNTKYFYRLAVSNSSGIVLGNTTSFKTKH